jgi:hypothetical protein
MPTSKNGAKADNGRGKNKRGKIEHRSPDASSWAISGKSPITTVASIGFRKSPIVTVASIG